MYAYVARQAIFDRAKEVIGYELLFRDGQQNCYPNIEPDEATSKLINQHHLSTELTDLTDGKKAFLNFYRDTLLYRFPTSLDPLTTVIEVIETTEVDAELIRACKHLHDLGYKLALDDYDFDTRWEPLFPYVAMVKIEADERSLQQLPGLLERIRHRPVKVVVERIETNVQFEQFLALGVDYFQGYFFTRPEVMQRKDLPVMKLNLLRMIEISARHDFAMSDMNSVLERDASLAFKLLRYMNNPANYQRQKISSLLHALNYMGQIEVKKFIALLAMANLGDSKPDELLTLSLSRAKFCQAVADYRGDEQNPPKGFLIGLLSTLDAMLDLSMQDIVRRLPLADDISAALRGESGDLRRYLELAQAYEQANWTQTEHLAEALAIPADLMAVKYQQAIQWADELKNTAI